MEPAIVGLVLDSSVLVAAGRKKLTTPQVIRNVREAAGDVPIVISAMTVAELAHGIYSRGYAGAGPHASPVSG